MTDQTAAAQSADLSNVQILRPQKPWRARHRDQGAFDEVTIRIQERWKESELSGDQIRKGGSASIIADGVEVYEFFFRDPMWALLRAHHVVGKLQEHASGWLVKA